MKNFTKHLLPIICSVATFMTTNLNAFQNNTQDNCTAVEVISATQGLQTNGSPVAANRSDVNSALYTPDKANLNGGFYSLGINGSITLKLGGAVFNQAGTDIMIYETSFSGDTCGNSDDETALIELSQYGDTWIEYGTICRDGAIDIESTGLDFVSQIRITDTTTMANGDGYDLDGIEAVFGCEDIPTQVCYASAAISYNPGLDSSGQPLSILERMNTNNALGEPEMDDTINFLSLGYGGEVTIIFDGAVLNNEGADIAIAETTFNNATYANYPESANVYVSQNGIDFYFIGSVVTGGSNDLDISNAPINLTYITDVKIVDTTPEGSVSNDGFDLDGVVALTGCNDPLLPNPAECYATNFIKYYGGTTISGGDIDPIRTETPENVLGEPETTDEYVFTSLGYGGEITLTFNGAVYNQEGDDLLFVETSFNSTDCETSGEYADIYVSADNINYHFAGTVCNSDNMIDISDAGDFDFIYYVAVVNNNELSRTNDGYDLDGVVALANCEDFDLDAYLNGKDDLLGVNTPNANAIGFKTYPNPTNGVSHIEFTPKTSGNVLIEVYDINGRNVGIVFNKEVHSGKVYNADFNGNNLVSGLYIYKITTGNSSITKKFVISK
ncbi:T9SS type A sorting domain-containing protein [Winogradskyella sp. PC D3.3]